MAGSVSGAMRHAGERHRLTSANVVSYLHSRGLRWPGGVPEVRELSGGISNTVLLVSWADDAVVIKQSLPELRVEQHWEFDPRRVIVEASCMRTLEGILGPREVPSVLDCDSEQLVFVMTAAAPGGQVWKHALLDGTVDIRAAARVGDLLGRIHRRAGADRRLAVAFDDLMPLVQGRIDPYHRTAALANPDLAPLIERDVERLMTNRRTLVLGDYSPKNVIVYADHVLALDFEVAHWGDPSFDAGFMLTHLLAKAIHMPWVRAELLEAARVFYRSYLAAAGEAAAGEADTATEVGVLLLCRVDGKSKLEYLTAAQRDQVRDLARRVIASGVTELEPIFAAAEAIPATIGHGVKA